MTKNIISISLNCLTISSQFQDWAFVARFCFISGRGRYEYQIEYEKRLGTPQLLLYYDDETQWPSVYKTDKSCLQKVAVLNAIDNQIVTLSTKRPESYLSGCRLTTSRERLRPPPAPPSATSSESSGEAEAGQTTASTASDEEDSSYFEQFLKSTTESPAAASTTGPTTTLFTDWAAGDDPFEAITLEPDNATEQPPGPFVPLRRDNDGLLYGNRLENDTGFQVDVEELFAPESSTEHSNGSDVRVRRSIPLWSREKTGTIIVSCSNAGGFTTVRERWWYIAIANCGSDKGIDIKYRFRMTNGPPGDFWHEHFSADEMCE